MPVHCKPPVQFTVYKKSRRNHRDHKFSRNLIFVRCLRFQSAPSIYRDGAVQSSGRESQPWVYSTLGCASCLDLWHRQDFFDAVAVCRAVSSVSCGWPFPSPPSRLQAIFFQQRIRLLGRDFVNMIILQLTIMKANCYKPVCRGARSVRLASYAGSRD